MTPGTEKSLGPVPSSGLGTAETATVTFLGVGDCPAQLGSNAEAIGRSRRKKT